MGQPLTESDAAALQGVIEAALKAAKDDRQLQLLAATVLASATGLYVAEKDGGGAIRSFGDALWNAWSTVCAVGESGCYPVTPAGRLIDTLLMLVGNPLYDQTKGRIGQALASLADTAPGGPPKPADEDVLAKLDAILQEVRAAKLAAQPAVCPPEAAP
jgi:hypothetical protein